MAWLAPEDSWLSRDDIELAARNFGHGMLRIPQCVQDYVVLLEVIGAKAGTVDDGTTIRGTPYWWFGIKGTVLTHGAWLRMTARSKVAWGPRRSLSLRIVWRLAPQGYFADRWAMAISQWTSTTACGWTYRSRRSPRRSGCQIRRRGT